MRDADAARRRLLALVSGGGDDGPAAGGTPARQQPPSADADLLDAYSRAVIGVVETIGPAVIGVAPRDTRRRGGSGSGFFVTPDGFALTNSHVAGGRERLLVTTADGDRLDAELVGDDPATDLALLRARAGDLPAAPLGDSQQLRAGQLVIAMGSPLGFQSTVSTGVVSALGRSMRGRDGRLIEDVVQHTAPLNPGNSGGPLLDSHGRVAAINTAIIPQAQGLGFAVPSATARWVVGELLAHGRVRRPFLGITASAVPVARQLVRQLDLLADRGVEVVDLEPRGPAAAAGVTAADVIVAVDGRLAASVDDLHRILTALREKEALTLTLIRSETLHEIAVRPRMGK